MTLTQSLDKVVVSQRKQSNAARVRQRQGQGETGRTKIKTKNTITGNKTGTLSTETKDELATERGNCQKS